MPSAPMPWTPTARGFFAASRGACSRLGQITGKEKRRGLDTDHRFGPRGYRRTAHLASQQELGILPQRRARVAPPDSDHPITPWADLKGY